MTWETLREKCLPLQVTSLCLEGEDGEIRLQVPQGGGGEEGEGLRAALEQMATGGRQSPGRAPCRSPGGPPGWGRGWSRGWWNPRDAPREQGCSPGAPSPAQTASPHRGLPSAPDGDTSSLVGPPSGWTA